MGEQSLGPRPEYGPTAVNFRCIAELKEVWRRFSWRGQAYGPEHDHAVEMILVKLGRIATGEFKADNYDDIIGYAQIARKLVEERCSIEKATPTLSSMDNSAAPAKDSSVDTLPSNRPQILPYLLRPPTPDIPVSPPLDTKSSPPISPSQES